MGGTADRTVSDFIGRLKQEYRVTKAILFGSRARDDALASSDYDLLIVSPDFAGVPFVKRMAAVLAFWTASQALEALCYTPEEFERKSNQLSIVRVAVEEGIEIAA